MRNRTVCVRAECSHKTVRFLPIGSHSGKPPITEHRSFKAGRSIRIYRVFASNLKTYCKLLQATVH